MARGKAYWQKKSASINIPVSENSYNSDKNITVNGMEIKQVNKNGNALTAWVVVSVATSPGLLVGVTVDGAISLNNYAVSRGAQQSQIYSAIKTLGQGNLEPDNPVNPANMPEFVQSSVGIALVHLSEKEVPQSENFYPNMITNSPANVSTMIDAHSIYPKDEDVLWSTQGILTHSNIGNEGVRIGSTGNDVFDIDKTRSKIKRKVKPGDVLWLGIRSFCTGNSDANVVPITANLNVVHFYSS